MQDVHLKLNPGLLCQEQHSKNKTLFTTKLYLKFKEKTTETLHLEHSFV